MQKSPMKKEIENYSKKNQRRRLWQRIVSMLTCIIVFCTTYALILPAITLSGEATCGYTEHSHSDDCYAQVDVTSLICDPVHEHTEECYDDEYALVCGKADYVLHTHDDGCYDADGNWICTLEKLEEHTHTDECWTLVEDENAHTHGDDCYSIELGELVCQIEESEGHAHGESCYGDPILTCTLEETEDHSHDEGCYTENLTCTEAESEGHVHTDECYEAKQVLICELEETQETSEPEYILTCTKPEVTAHTHDDDECYETREDEDGNEYKVLVCTELEVLEHQHTAECTETTTTLGDLICEEEEHVHLLACYSDLTADLETAEIWELTMKDVDLMCDASSDLLAIAESQLGYTESKNNYIVLDDGATLKGYTRYGQWNGTPYEDWNETFVEFCLYYAGIEEDAFPRSTSEKTWIEVLSDAGYFMGKDYVPQPGDLIFVDTEIADQIKEADHVGIISSVDADGYITAIFGDYKNEVRKDTFTPSDVSIVGYAVLELADEQVLDDVPGVFNGEDDPWNGTVESADETEPSEEVTGADVPSLSATMEFVLSVGEITGIDSVGKLFSGTSVRLFANSVSATSTGIDMTDLITNVKIYHKTTAWGDTWKEISSPSMIQKGDLVRFGISYQIPGNTLSASNNSIFYQLPIEGLTDSKSGIVVNDQGEEVGTYTISDTGLITITFHDHYVQENAGGVVIDGTINFDSTAEELDTNNDGKIEIEFTDSEKVEIEIEQTITDDLTVEKTASEVNDDGTVNYTITVSSKNGTAQEVVLDDWMNNVTYLEDFKVVKNGLDYTVLDIPTPGDTSVGLTLPQMVAGDTYTITYTGVISSVSGGVGTAGNGVTVTSKDNDGHTLTDSADVRVDYSVELIDKSYMLTTDGKINWKIVVGEQGQDLGGWTLSDTINGAPLQGTVSIKDSSGNEITTTLPYTFASGVTGPVTVTYTTSLDYNIGANSLSNTASLTPPTNNNRPVHSDSQYVQDPNNTGTNWPLNKDAKDLTVAADGVAVIDWTYSINASLGGIYVSDQGGDKPYWYFTDSLQSGQYYTDDQWSALEASIKAAMIAAFNDSAVYNGTSWDDSNIGNLYSLEQIKSGDKIVGFTVKVYESALKGTQISFNYQSTGSIGDGSSQVHFQNSASINNKTWDAGGIDYYPVVIKMDGTNGSTNDTEHAKADLTDDTLKWKIQLSVPKGSKDVEIVESLPSMVDLTSLTMSLTVNWKTTTVTLVDSNTTFDNNTVTVLFTATDWNNNTVASGNVTITKNEDGTYTIKLDDALAEKLVGYNVTFDVTTKLKDDFNFTDENSEGLKIEVLENQVTVNYQDENDNTETATDSQKQTITNEDTTQQLVKTAGSFDKNTNKVPYTLEVNPNASDLAGDSDYLTLSDRLKYSNTEGQTYFNASLMNVKVYRVNSDNTRTELKLAGSADSIGENQYYYTYTISEYRPEWSTTYYETYSDMQFIIPDNTHIIITYEYLYTGLEGQSTNFTNTATLREVEQYGSSNSNGWYTIQESGATAELNSINVYKVDASNFNKLLPGAKFELYRWNDSTSAWEFDHIVESNESSSLELIGLEINQAYYLVETKAPVGYILDQSKQYFMIYDSTKSYVYAPDDFPTSAYYTKGRSIYITNEKDSTEIAAEKVWKDASGSVIDPPSDSTATVELVQVWSRFPHGFDTSTIGNSASVSLGFGKYSNDTDVFGPVSIPTHIGDIIDITLVTPDDDTFTSVKVEKEDGSYEFVQQYMDYPAGLMEITSSANNHIPYTKVQNEDDTYTYTFSYLVKDASATLRGWVYPENADSGKVQITYSIRPYTTLTNSNTTETTYGSYTFSGTNWSTSWTNLPEYQLADDGRIVGYYSYYVRETGVTNANGFSPSYSTDTDGTLVITNKQVETIDISVRKEWLNYDGTTVSDTSGYPSVEVKLYRIESTSSAAPDASARPGTLVNTYTLSYSDDSNTENDWVQVVNDLPKTGEDANGNTIYYTYYFEETVISGYEITYSSDGTNFTSASPNVTTNGAVTTIRNKDNGKISLEVEKKWVDSSGKEITDPPTDSITFDLYKWNASGSSSDGELSGDIYSVSGVIYGGKALSSTALTTLDETKVSAGTRVTVNYISYYENGNYYGNVTVKNVDDDSQYTINAADDCVTKNKIGTLWGFDMILYSYTIDISYNTLITASTGTGEEIKQYKIDGTDYYLNDTWFSPPVALASDETTGAWELVNGSPFTLTSANDWKLLISNLEKGQYKIVENSTEYDVTYTINGTASESGETGSLDSNSSVVITNKVEDETVNLPVSKQWFASDGVTESIPTDITSISFYILQNGKRYYANSDYIITDADLYTISSENGWATVVYGLPKLDDKDNPYTYTIEEAKVGDSALAESGYKVEYTTDTNGNPVIKNTKLIAITVTKRWIGPAPDYSDLGSEAPVDSIQFYLYKVTTGQDGVTSETLVTGSPFTITKANGWTFTVENLEPGTYRVEEISATDYLDDFVTYSYSSSVGGAAGDTATFPGGVTDAAFAITNSPFMNVTVEKQWPEGTAPVDGLKIQVALYRYKSTTAPTESALHSFSESELQKLIEDGTVTLERTVTLPEDGKTSFHKTFKDLPLFGYENKTLYYYTYFVLETTPGYDKTYSIVDNTGKLTTLASTGTVTITNESTSIQVTKAWVDESGNALTDVPSSITFQIIQHWTIDNVAYSRAFNPDLVNHGDIVTSQPESDTDSDTGSTETTDPTYFTLSSSDGWSKVFAGLPLYVNVDGTLYPCTYTVQEFAVDGYDTKISNSTVASGVDGEPNTYKSDITNLKTGATSISVEKVWDTTADTAVQVQLYQFENVVTDTNSDGVINSSDIPTNVGKGGTESAPVWDFELKYYPGAYDPTKTSSDVFRQYEEWDATTQQNVTKYVYFDNNGYVIPWWPMPNNEGTVTITTVDNSNSTTTYTVRWSLSETWDTTYGCILFSVEIPNAVYAIGDLKANVTDVSVIIDGQDLSTVDSYWATKSPYIGPTWADGSYTNNLEIKWYDVYADKEEDKIVNNTIQIQDYLEVTFTLPTRTATTDYVELETEVTSDYLLANNAKVVTKSGTYIPYTSDINTGSNLKADNYVPLSNNNAWKNTWSDLPLYGYNDSGQLVYYTYYVLEISDSDSWHPAYSVVDPITSGVIGITNNDTPEYEEPSYELPSTGSIGTSQYTLGGVVLMLGAAVVLMYNKKKGRKGVPAP